MTGGGGTAAATKATFGGDTGVLPNIAGTLAMSGGALFVMDGAAAAAGSGSEGAFEVGAVFGTGTATVDASTVRLSGFDTAEVRVGYVDATGTLTVTNGGRIEAAGAQATKVDIGSQGSGTVAVRGGSVIDLGGNGTVQVGGPGPGDPSGFGNGRLEVSGAGSAVRGVQTAWIGSDPAGVTDTPRAPGTLSLSGGAAFGNAGAATNLGVASNFIAGTATLAGALNFDGGAFSMMEDAHDIFDTVGNVTVRQGVGFASLAANDTGSDLWRIDGDFALAGGSLFFEVMGATGYRFMAGDRHVLMTADSFVFDDPSKLRAQVHAGFNPDFGFVFGVERGAFPDRFVFEALSDMDGPGAPALTLGGDQGPATARYDAASMQVLIEGGRFQNAWAQNLDALTGSQLDDSLVMTGMTEGIALAGAAGNDTLVGGEGNDVLNGGDGTDRLNGGAGDDRLFGGVSVNDLRDVIFGGDGNDRIDGGYGNDELYGGNGNDTIEGGFGVDTLIGNDGDDVLTGSAFSDLIFGGNGNDFLNGGFGSDRVNGGPGADRFYHLGIADHGSDWIQDYAADQGDRLVWGGGAAVRSQFQVNLTETANAGAAGVDEAFVIYRPTGQILWALVDGGAQASINLQIGGQVFDLMA
jgi:Ca2+-binding RTX toxin-like protein